MKTILHILKLASLIASVLMTSSCGNGGSSNPSQPPSGTLQTINTSITIDPAVPVSVGSTIAKLVSPITEVPFGSALSIPISSGSKDSAVIALDANDNMILASLASSSATTLDAQTTALALARFALGQLESITPAQANQAILAAAEYPNLVSAINLALIAGTPPLESDGVIQSVITLAAQAGQALQATITTTTMYQPRILSLSNPTVDSTQLPYIIFPPGSTNAQFSITARNAAPSGGVNLVNGLHIAFAAQSTDGAGSPIPPAQGSAAADGTILLPNAAFWSSLINPASAVSVPGNGNEFNVAILQTKITHTFNVTNEVQDIVNMSLDFLPGGSFLADCGGKVVTAILSSDALATAISQPTVDSVASYFGGISVKDVKDAIDTCNTPTRPPSTSWVRFGIKLVGKILVRTLKSLTTVAIAVKDGAGLAVETAELGMYWSISPAVNVGVCENGGNLVNCAATLVVSPASPQVTVGQTLALDVTAKDISGNATATPTGLVWTTSSATTATVDATGLITGVAAGTTNITVTDPVSLVSNSITVTVNSGGNYVAQGGLTWMPVSSTQYTWSQASALCSGTINGQTGWRLPTDTELSALYASGAMNGQGWTVSSTWSSTPVPNSVNGHVVFVLSFGYSSPVNDGSGQIYATCVR